MTRMKMIVRFLIASVFIITTVQISISQSPIPSGAVLQKIATGFQQPEGPVWKDGIGLLFSG